MADNIALPAAAGTCAADDVGGILYQRIKLASGEADSAEMIGDTDLGEARALWTDQRTYSQRLQTTSAGLTTSVTVYTSGDQLGTIFAFPGAARATGRGGEIVSAVLLDKADVLGACDLYLFRESVTVPADNAAFTISDADMQSFVGVINFATSTDVGANHIVTPSASSASMPLMYDCAATTLYGALVTRTANAVFAAVTDIWITLHVKGF